MYKEYNNVTNRSILKNQLIREDNLASFKSNRIVVIDEKYTSQV